MEPVIFPPRIKLANLPTPIEQLEKLSKELGANIFLKRDDFTGIELSGNKIRKLEFHLAQAGSEGATAVITTGGIQSNHCRTTVFAARKLGLTPILILMGQEPETAEGNYLLDILAGAKIFFAEAEDFFHPEKVIAKATDWAVNEGLKPVTIPLGASDALGLWGYIAAIKEVVEYSRDTGVRFDRIVCAVGSGGTYASLLIGSQLYNFHSKIIGFNVLETAEFLHEIIWGQIKGFEEKFDYNIEIEQENIRLVDGYVGEGYGKVWPELRLFIKNMAKLEGVIFDPVYTGKAFFGLTDQIKQGKILQGENILFMHTGGVYGLFPFSEFSNVLLERNKL